MQARMFSWFLAIAGVLLVGAAFLPGPAAPTYAAPLRALTATVEPPTPTSPPPPPTETPVTPPTNTPVPPTNTPGTSPTNTPVPPTNTPAPTRPPEEGFADPAITKSVSAPVARISDTLEFTLAVTNLGNIPAENVTVNDTVPSELDLLEATASRGTATISGQTVTGNLGTIQPGEVLTIRLVTRVNATARPPQLTNTATVSTTSPGDNPNNNTSTVVVQIPVETSSGNETPTPTPAGGAPTPTPTGPVTLPGTGGTDQGMSGGLLLLGVLLLAASWILRQRAARQA